MLTADMNCSFCMKLSCLPLAEFNSFLLWTNQTPRFTHEHTLAILMNCARISALVLGFSSFRISLTTQKLVCRSGRRKRGRERRTRRGKEMGVGGGGRREGGGGQEEKEKEREEEVRKEVGDKIVAVTEQQFAR